MSRGNPEVLVGFGTGGNAGRFCRHGWSVPEAGYTWTIGRGSSLELPRPSSPADYWLVLDLVPFTWKDVLPVQRLTVLVNEIEVGTFQVGERSALECSVPWSTLEPSETVSITLRHPDAAKPNQVNGAPDDREIAFAVERLHLLPQLGFTIAQPDLSAASPALSNHELMMQFESLGENCEFGLAQRSCGAEPLGLLRFASAPLPNLLEGLRHGFEGMGSPEQTDVRPSDDNSEYLVVDRRYGFLYHPWVRVGEIEPEEVLRREQKHLVFLRRKLLEDLKEGKKIFVYHGMQRLSEPAALRLLSAIRVYGPCTLLWVEQQDPYHPAGAVEALKPGLLKAYINRFAPGDNAHDFLPEAWLEICRRAWPLRNAG